MASGCTIDRQLDPALLYWLQVIPVDTNTNDPGQTFFATPTLDEIIAQQGKGPVMDIGTLHGGFWPEDERLEDFLAALHEWRGHVQASKSDPAA